MKLNRKDANEIISLVWGELGFEMKYEKPIGQVTITDEHIEDYPELKKVKGYTFKEKRVGEHKNDGQIVDYTFTIISPDKKNTTKISTEMSLMNGFDFYSGIEI